jgi:hypothetical protein
MGSVNIVVANNIKGNGFFLAIEKVDPVQIKYMVLDPLIGETDMLMEETHARFVCAEELFDWSGSEDWLDKEGEELLIAEEIAGTVLTEEDSNLATPVPSNCSESKLALHMVLHVLMSNCTLDKEGYCACSSSSDLELVHLCRDGVTIMDLWAANYVFPFIRSDPDSLPTHSDCHEVTYDD